MMSWLNLPPVSRKQPSALHLGTGRKGDCSSYYEPCIVVTIVVTGNTTPAELIKVTDWKQSKFLHSSAYAFKQHKKWQTCCCKFEVELEMDLKSTVCQHCMQVVCMLVVLLWMRILFYFEWGNEDNNDIQVETWKLSYFGWGSLWYSSWTCHFQTNFQQESPVAAPGKLQQTKRDCVEQQDVHYNGMCGIAKQLE